MSTLYETDFYSWTQEQARMLRRAGGQRINAAPALDWQELAGEVEDLGRSLEHLLKWRHQPSLRGMSWELTIAHQRLELARLLEKNAGLKRKSATEFADAYVPARLQAAKETGLALGSLPERCPFTREQVLDNQFLPVSGT